MWRRIGPDSHSFALGDNEYLCDWCWCDLAMTVPLATTHYVLLSKVISTAEPAGVLPAANVAQQRFPVQVPLSVPVPQA